MTNAFLLVTRHDQLAERGFTVDALTNLYERLRAQAPSGTGVEPPSYEQWLQYWNDEETEIGNLRNFQHWLSRALDTSTL